MRTHPRLRLPVIQYSAIGRAELQISETFFWRCRGRRKLSAIVRRTRREFRSASGGRHHEYLIADAVDGAHDLREWT
jgi:hypothetical protein